MYSFKIEKLDCRRDKRGIRKQDWFAVAEITLYYAISHICCGDLRWILSLSFPTITFFKCKKDWAENIPNFYLHLYKISTFMHSASCICTSKIINHLYHETREYYKINIEKSNSRSASIFIRWNIFLIDFLVNINLFREHSIS